eukprot:CAMPEP_0194369276 /NCGR_PEP_ID=MMETSP0174-20130528/17555_1 /TAXON_ID=216777 /ORGANISM="Proboscia alata, Strain PI-D3" /LENGTH=1140 /DNA_ID=CAMNT_0039146117 /DNA_START=109 /DNA_END=3531 /DNA_ORIENTATION=-
MSESKNVEHLDDQHQKQKQQEQQHNQQKEIIPIDEQQILPKLETKGNVSLNSSPFTSNPSRQPEIKQDYNDIKNEELLLRTSLTASSSSSSSSTVLCSGILFKRRDYFHKQWRRRYFVLRKNRPGILEYHLLPDSSLSNSDSSIRRKHLSSRSMSIPTAQSKVSSTNNSYQRSLSVPMQSLSSGTTTVPTANYQQSRACSPPRIAAPSSSKTPRGTIDLTGCTAVVDNQRSNPLRNFYAFTIYDQGIASLARLYAPPGSVAGAADGIIREPDANDASILPTMGSHIAHLAVATEDERRRWVAAIRESCQNVSSQDEDDDENDDDYYEDYYDEDGNTLYSDSSTITTMPSMKNMKTRVLVERDLREIRQCCTTVKEGDEEEDQQVQVHEVTALSEKISTVEVTTPLNVSDKFSQDIDAIDDKKYNINGAGATCQLREGKALYNSSIARSQGQASPSNQDDGADKACRQHDTAQAQSLNSTEKNSRSGRKSSSSKNSRYSLPPPNMPEEISFSSRSDAASQEVDKENLLLDDMLNEDDHVENENVLLNIGILSQNSKQPVANESASDHDIVTTSLLSSFSSSSSNERSSNNGTPTPVKPPPYSLNKINSIAKSSALFQEMQSFSCQETLIRYVYNASPALIWIFLKVLLPANTATLTRGMTFVVLLSLGFFPVSNFFLEAADLESRLLVTFTSPSSSDRIKSKTAATASNCCTSTIKQPERYKLPPVIFLVAIILSPKFFLYDATLISSKLRGVVLIFCLFVGVRSTILAMLGPPVDLLPEGEIETASRKNVVSNISGFGKTAMLKDNNNIITCRLGVDLQRVLKFISQKRKEYSNNKGVNLLTINHIIVKAVAQAISEQEVLNGRRVHMPLIGVEGFYPNRGIDISVEALYCGFEDEKYNKLPTEAGVGRSKTSRSATKNSNKSIVTKLTRVNENSLHEIACQMEESESSHLSSTRKRINGVIIHDNDDSNSTNSGVSDITASTSLLQKGSFIDKALDRAIRFPVNRLSEVLGMKLRGATVDGNRFGSCLVLTSKAGDQTEAEVCAAALSSTAGCALPIMVFVGQVGLKKMKVKAGIQNGGGFLQQHHSTKPVPILPISIAIDHPVCAATCERFAERVKQLVSFPELLEGSEKLYSNLRIE